MTPEAILQTQKWIREVVIGCNFCPFAVREMRRQTIAYHGVEGPHPSDWQAAFEQGCRTLDENPQIETLLVILTRGPGSFDDYLDLVDWAQDHLERNGYEGIYQLASFHPLYRFAGSRPKDPANFTNRSPYPMLHLLREESLELAIANHPDPEGIPEQNVALARQRGWAAMQSLFQSCLESTP